MVHVPATLGVRVPGRRGRPPKNRDQPVVPPAAEDGQPQKPTFVSSLAFKVHQPTSTTRKSSASPASASSSMPKTPSQPQAPVPASPAPEAPRGRAQRKSKMDAMAALTARSVSPSSEAAKGAAAAARGASSSAAKPAPTPKPPAQPELPELDFSDIKMPKRSVDPPRTAPRPFGLEDCPAFYPTAEEWKDPMKYVKSIADKARQYGICKVIPPEGWNMPFVTDTRTFSFKTRLQRLNSIEASSRAKLNFLEQLYRFHQQQDQVGPVVPTINYKPLDLWLLRKEVHNREGFDVVSRTKQWGEIARNMGYDGMVGVSTQLKNAYIRIILPFEQFTEHIRNSPSMAALSPAINFDLHAGPSPQKARMGGRMGAVKPPTSRMSSRSLAPKKPESSTRSQSVSSSALSEPPDDTTAVHNGIPKPDRDDRSATGTSKSPVGPYTPLPQMAVPKEKPSNYVQGDTCEVCHSGDKGTQMLLCDGCDRGFHTFCLDPPLTTIPKDQWFCHICLFDTGGDYGFDEGEDHTLTTFKARDHAFRKAWFEAHPPKLTTDDPVVRKYKIGEVEISEDDVEREFWRLVESPLETVEVEYGADVHSTTHGSASPSLETHPLDPYSKDGWNMNNMPIVSESLLRYVKSDISGMTVPWIYVGMVFSTFCWHNEDHYTYSVNYMHWGETKTWYGIPGDDAEKFEAAIRSEAPDLFDAQPDLLFQLVTLMSPKRLKEAGVRVYGCNQRPGEYVITFPKAYHAGFNHGLNMNEAVNFAVPDWLNDGRDCVRRYQEHQKLPVFSHEELLITITQHDQSIKTATWVKDSLKEMIEGHIALRNQMREQIPSLSESLEEHDVPEEQYQCAVCKGFSYLAQVTCDCTKQVACVEHWSSLCSCPQSQRKLRKRFDDNQLLAILARVEERSHAPETWRSRLREVLMASPTPDLPSLMELLHEAEHMAVPMSEYSNLKKFVEKADSLATSIARVIRPRPPPVFRRHIPRRNGSSADVPIFNGEFPLSEVRALVNEATAASFSPEDIDQLRSVEDWAADWKARATRMLGEAEQMGPTATLDTARWEALLRDAYAHDVQLDHLTMVGTVVKRCRLVDELRSLDDTALASFDDVQELSRQAKICSLSPEHDAARKLRDLVARGDEWQKLALVILNNPIRGLDELDNLVSPPQSVPVVPALLERIDTIRADARRKERAAKQYISPSNGRRAAIGDVLKFIGDAKREYIIPAVTVLESLAMLAVQYEKNSADILQSRYSPQKPLFEELRDMRQQVRTNLKIFFLPNFDRVDGQLVRHDAWLEKLPWYRTPEPAMQGKLIVDDVLSNTRPDDMQAPTDVNCTCICPHPVQVTPERQAEAVQCDHCSAKFHSKCIEGSCPFCDHHHWNGALSKARNFEYNHLLPIAREAPDLTRNYSLAWKHLDAIITCVDKLMRAMDEFLTTANNPNTTMTIPQRVAQIRHFLRKLYKIQFVIRPRVDMQGYGYTLCHMHRSLAGPARAQLAGGDAAGPRKKTNRRPKFEFTSENAIPGPDGTQCLCRGVRSGDKAVKCSACERNYHSSCVRYEEPAAPQVPAPPPSSAQSTASSSATKPWRCPLCVVRRGKQYPHATVRVRTVGETDPEVYVDTKTCLENYSSHLIRHRLPRSNEDIVILELERFIPGSNPPGSNTNIGPPGSSDVMSSSSSGAAAPKPPPQRQTSQSQSSVPPTPTSAAPSTILPSPTIPLPPPPQTSTSSSSAHLGKRKSPNSPAVENPRRVKLVLREEDKSASSPSAAANGTQ